MFSFPYKELNLKGIPKSECPFYILLSKLLAL